jgi:KDO2-lipid IV(A) lauroyltransferase
MLKKLKNTLIYFMVLFLIWFVRKLPRGFAIRCLGKMGSLCFYLVGSERKKTIRHLEWIFHDQWPQEKIRQVAKQVFINLGRNMVDVIRFKMKDENSFFQEHITCEGWEHFEPAYKKGKGVVCLVSHMGAFELLHHFMGWKGYLTCVTGTQIYDPRLNRLLVENRRGPNNTYIERGTDSPRQIIRCLRDGNLFGVLLDQDTKVEGVFAPFLGKNAYTPSAPVKLAMKTGAAIVPFIIRMTPDFNHKITIEPEIVCEDTGDFEKDLITNVTRCNDIISKWILKTPDQWVWMHERWKTTQN